MTGFWFLKSTLIKRVGLLGERPDATAGQGTAGLLEREKELRSNRDMKTSRRSSQQPNRGQ